MSSFKGLLIFVTGAGIGSIITWKLMENKYEQRIQEEVDSVKEHFSKREKIQNKELEEAHEVVTEDTKPRNRSYEELVASHGYTGKYSSDSTQKKAVDIMQSRPRVISPDDFGETGYSTIYLSYYADNILADDEDNIIEDVEKAIGTDFVNHFGEYEDDPTGTQEKIDTEKGKYESEKNKKADTILYLLSVYQIIRQFSTKFTLKQKTLYQSVKG